MTTLPQPKPGISAISPYVGGKSKVEGVERVIKLSSNENPWGASPKAKAAFKEQADALHRYPDGGHTLLREAIADVYDLTSEQLVCGSGSDELIGMLVHAYAGHGDEILFSEHGFLMYRIYAQANGCAPVTAPERNLHADVDALLSKVTKKTKILFLANPNNPTGTMIPYSEVVRLRQGLPEEVILGLDAAYAEYLDQTDYRSGSHLVREGTNTVVLHTFSKIHGLSALRLGFAYARPEIVDTLNRVRSPFNVNAPALAAGIAAVRDTDYVAQIRRKNAEQRQRLCEAIGALGHEVVPSVTNFLLVKFGAQAKAVNQHLAQQGVIVREVGNYGLPDYLRISVGTEDDNTRLLEALKSFAHTAAA